MKKILSLLLGSILLFGCATYTQVRSPRYFNEDIEILDYSANPWRTEWVVKAAPGEKVKLVFQYETISFFFTEDPRNKGEFIITVISDPSEIAQ